MAEGAPEPAYVDERGPSRPGRAVRIAGLAVPVLLVAVGIAAALVDRSDERGRLTASGRGSGHATTTVLDEVLFEDDTPASVADTTPPVEATATTVPTVPRPTIPQVVRDLVPATFPLPPPLATTTSTTPPPACPTPTPWSVTETGVYTVPTTGGPGRRILSYPQGAGEPQELAYSPDGRHLAITRSTGRADGSPEVTTLHLADADGTDERELVPATTAPRNIAWSPDGTRLVLRDFGPEPGQLSTSVLEVASERLTRVATHGQSVGTPRWSPDGTRLAWTGITSPGGVYVTDVATATTAKVDDGDSQSVEWSPDGSELAVARYGGRGGVKAVDVLRTDGSSKRTVHAGAIAAAWSPRERSHLVTDTAGALHLADPDGGGNRFLANAHLAGWLGSGTDLVATSAEGIHLVDLQGCRRTLVAGSGNDLALRAWSPAGTEVLFVRFR